MTVTEHLALGGADIGGEADVAFVHGSNPVVADVVYEWDVDNDGDFSETVENITGFVLDSQWQYGRDFPSNLTGKSSPGRLKITLNNDDNRFNFFNGSSPLTQAPFSLRTGRKLRVRTVEAADPDPTLLARDRFFGGPASLGFDELGNAWTDQTTSRFARVRDSSGATLAQPDTQADSSASSGVEHIATVDVGQDDYYLQARWRFVDGGFDDTSIGIVYRFDDIDNYGLLRFKTPPGQGGPIFLLQEVNAGVLSTTASAQIEYRPDDYFGLLVSGATATIFHNGVELVTDTAFTSTATTVGIFSEWRVQRPPSFHEFYAWDGLPAPTDGILFTGDVTAVTPSVDRNQRKTAVLTARGVLGRAATQDISPPNSVGVVLSGNPNSFGSQAGILVGGALGRAGMLHPPGPIDRGDVTFGSVGLGRQKALNAMRAYEEAELGFLHETPEGQIGFDSRSARADAPVSSSWGDTDDTQFSYEFIEPFDWRQEIVNRVEASVAPITPEREAFTGATGDGSDIGFILSGGDVSVGDLMLVVIASSIQAADKQWLVPPGWTEHRNAGDKEGKLRIYSKVIDEDDIGASHIFYDVTTETADWVLYFLLFNVGTWYGDIEQGVEVAEPRGLGPPHSQSRAEQGVNNPPVIFPPWAPEPSVAMAFRGGMEAGTETVTDPNNDVFYAPNGFHDMAVIYGNASTQAAALQRAMVNTNDEVIDPSPFLNDDNGEFSGFEFVETVTIAVRGFAGDPPEIRGGQKVVVEDLQSQQEHNAIRTHELASGLFKDVTDATAYAEAVLDRFSDDRPIFKISFTANKNEAHRQQAVRRRLGDKIRLVADATTGMGVEGDFFVENIAHRITDGAARWVTTWELSPA